MRSRIFFGTLALAVVGMCSVASATLIVYDDFDSASLDLAKWGQFDTTGTSTQSASVITLTGGAAWSTLRSTQTYDGAVQNSYEFKYIGSTLTTGDSPYVGVATADASTSAVVRAAAGTWYFSVDNALVGASITAPSSGDIWNIVRTADTWQLLVNGSLTRESASGVGPQSGDALSYLMQVRPNDVIQLDYVGLQVVPEPMTIAMLTPGLVGLLAFARRKRR